MLSSRTKYVINPKFQLRTAFSIIGFVSVVFALVVAIAGYNLLQTNKRISNMIEINKAITDTITAPSPDINESEYQNYVRMQNLQDQNKKDLDNLISVNMIFISVVIGVVIVHAFVLFYILIRQTHRIAGPIYVMTGYMRQIIDGKIPEHLRALRKKDYFQDCYDVFNEMVNVLRRK